MKNSPLPPLMVGVLLLIGLLTALFTIRYYFSLKELQRLQIEYARMTQRRNMIQSLANEAVEYSKSNSAIDPILFEFELKPKPGAAATPAQPKAAK
jgi:hypothetical protein